MTSKKTEVPDDLTVGELKKLLSKFDDSARVLLRFINLDGDQEDLIVTTINAVAEDKQSGAPILFEPSAVNWRPKRKRTKRTKRTKQTELEKLLTIEKKEESDEAGN